MDKRALAKALFFGNFPMKYHRIYFLIICLICLSACADRPSFVSVRKTIESLEKSESLQNVVVVKNLKEVSSYKKDNEFIVEVSFEQQFLLDLSEAAKMMFDVMQKSGISEQAKESSDLHLQNLEQILKERFGSFYKGNLRPRRIDLVFRKNADRWVFTEKRANWRDLNLYLP